MTMHRIRWFSLLLALLFCLSGCGDDTSPAAASPAVEDIQQETTVPMSSYSETSSRNSGTSYKVPDFAVAEFHADKAEGNEAVKLDLSAVKEGYVAVSATSKSRLKFQVICGDVTYNYDMASDGTPSIFPLQSGSGAYRFRVMENVSESRYAELYSAGCDVMLENDFAPFLRTNDYVPYDKNAKCVTKAKEISSGAADAVGVVAGVYEFVCATVTYDREKASTVQAGYLPEPDETMKTGKGICFDYASLAAAMLRSQGIPTKMVFGYVSPNDLYHAWNMFYTEETGWVTVGFQVSAGDWNRLDLTFSAGGADGAFIGDGNNYTDLYFY